MYITIKAVPKPVRTLFSVLAVLVVILGWVFGHVGYAFMNMLALSVIYIFMMFILPNLFAPYEISTDKLDDFFNEKV